MELINNTILSICIPTYNRKDVIIPDITDYLSCNDSRYNIFVNDNASTDGTSQLLKEFNDPRIKFHINDTNQGCCINYIKSLYGATGEYCLFLIDKDRINIEYLSSFIDILEHEKPQFGYVDLNCTESSIQKYNPGESSIIHGGGYASKHPSGFYFKTELFKEEISLGKYSSEIKNNFVFTLDMIAAALGSHNPACVILLPLITDANHRTDATNHHTYSYNESNIYWGSKERIHAFDIFTNHLCTLDCPIHTKKAVLSHLLHKTMQSVSTQLQSFYWNAPMCSYYGITPRDIPLRELVKNLYQTITVAHKKIHLYNIPIKTSFLFTTFSKQLFITLKFCLKRSVKKLIRKS